MSLHDETVESIHRLVVTQGHEPDEEDPHGYGELYDGDKLGPYPLRIQRSWNFGDGGQQGIIFTLTDPVQGFYQRHFQITGYYSSWGSSDWDGPLEEMVAIEQLTVFYAPKGGSA